jgi:multimeric flavodoxin WrbA
MERLLGVSGSPRAGGNTQVLLEAALGAAERSGAQTRLFSVAGRTLAPCLACGQCTRDLSGACVQHDAMDELSESLVWAEAVIFGTPVYMNSMSAQLKAVFDRCRPLWWGGQQLSGKVAAVICVGAGRWGGQEVAAEHVLSCALNNGMTLPRVGTPESWRVCAQAREPGEAEQDARAMEEAARLGQHLAGL